MLFLWECTCGKKFTVYIPKQKLPELTAHHALAEVDWCAEDAEEVSSGQLKDARQNADDAGYTFIDGREEKNIQCECGNEIDFLAEIPKVH